MNIALYMLEVVGAMLAEADPHPEVFDLLHNGLARLAQADAPLPAVLAYFQWRLLRHVGLLGDMTMCVSCGKAVGTAVPPNRSVYFSSRQGGLLCADCESAAAEKYRLSADALAGLSVLHAVGRGAKGVTLPDNQAKQLNRLLTYHIASQLGKPPKMAKHAIA
ncbi:MAG: DNA repair protein RecO [Planctomycetaceae bacterium]|nr:MAG: DNA repair protein RecO [Planctomycetaceae bacterium]